LLLPLEEQLPIDGCHRSFDELAQGVLPRYMVELREAMKAPIPLLEFAIKGDGPVTLCRRYGLENDPMGCYVLIEDGQPVYVGISKHVIQRLMEHVRGGDHLSATLVYRITVARHPYNGTAANAMQDNAFRMRFDETRHELLNMSVAFVAISNPLELYLFEAYCAMELDTGFDTGGWNTFETH